MLHDFISIIINYNLQGGKLMELGPYNCIVVRQMPFSVIYNITEQIIKLISHAYQVE